MNCGTMAELDVELERKRLGGGEPAFRCDLALRGSQGRIRDAVVAEAIPAVSREAALIAVAWARDVGWRKRVRVAGRGATRSESPC